MLFHLSLVTKILASEKLLTFVRFRYMNPLVYGQYPASMKILVGNRLPKFTVEQSKKLIGSYDFLGLNYYTAQYAAHIPTPPNTVNLSFSTDQHVNLTCKFPLQFIAVSIQFAILLILMFIYNYFLTKYYYWMVKLDIQQLKVVIFLLINTLPFSILNFCLIAINHCLYFMNITFTIK